VVQASLTTNCGGRYAPGYRRLACLPVDGVSNPRPGTGRPCIVCRRAIEPTEVERQLDGVGIVLIAHEACYMLWREESVLFLTSKRP
jgi:hypothetical protein